MYPWDKPKRNLTRQSKPHIFSGSWRDLPWTELYGDCGEVQKDALDTASEAHKQRYDEWISDRRHEIEKINPEAGFYEGDLGEKYPFSPLSVIDRLNISNKARAKTVEDFVAKYQLKSFSSQLMTDIIKHISTYKLSTTDSNDYDPARLKNMELTEDGRPLATKGHISAIRLHKSMITDDTMKGLYYFLMLDTRSSYLEKQYASPYKSWCALVPLIMSAFKIHHGIPYSHWHKNEIVAITNPKLHESMMAEPVDFSRDTLFRARTEGLLIKSGKDLGNYRNPLYTYKLYGVAEFKGLPDYIQTQLTQIWCAHPDNRTKYMILDHVNWDKIPLPLVDSEVISKPAYSSSGSNSGSKPSDEWELNF